MNTLKNLEKDERVYESDFVLWYVDWSFGDDSLDSEDDTGVSASSEAKFTDMKSNEEIGAAFSRFIAKEGSWKCGMYMVSNGPEETKCSVCEAPNPAAPKVKSLYNRGKLLLRLQARLGLVQAGFVFRFPRENRQNWRRFQSMQRQALLPLMLPTL